MTVSPSVVTSNNYKVINMTDEHELNKDDTKKYAKRDKDIPGGLDPTQRTKGDLGWVHVYIREITEANSKTYRLKRP